MTKAAPWRRLEKKIADADRSGVVDRWKYGRALLADRRLTSETGHLRDDVVEGLISEARAAGFDLSEEEIRRRLDCAQAYSSESEIGRAAAGVHGWRALVDAGFPPPQEQEDSTRPALLDRRGQVDPAVQPWQQPTLDEDNRSVFPREIRIGGTTLDRDACTLRTLTDYLNERERWTRAHTRKNAQLRAHLDALIDACGGDLTIIYREAVHRADHTTKP